MLYLPQQITVYFIVIEHLDGWVRPPKTLDSRSDK